MKLPTHKLPEEWKYAGYKAPFAMYANSKLVAAAQLIHPKPGFVTKHISVTKINGQRPEGKDIDKVRKDFFDPSLAPVRENNRIIDCSELVRNLWQRVEVSALTGDILDTVTRQRIKEARACG